MLTRLASFEEDTRNFLCPNPYDVEDWGRSMVENLLAARTGDFVGWSRFRMLEREFSWSLRRCGWVSLFAPRVRVGVALNALIAVVFLDASICFGGFVCVLVGFDFRRFAQRKACGTSDWLLLFSKAANAAPNLEDNFPGL